MSHAIIIPIYCENRNTINLCNELQNFGAEHIVVVNDGLNPKSEYFNELTSIGCHLVHLKNNNGKGASLKAGIKYAHGRQFLCLEQLDVPCDFLPCHLLPLRTGDFRAAEFLRRHRRRLEVRHSCEGC